MAIRFDNYDHTIFVHITDGGANRVHLAPPHTYVDREAPLGAHQGGSSRGTDEHRESSFEIVFRERPPDDGSLRLRLEMWHPLRADSPLRS
jgi:hypothetical protein